MTFSYVSVNSRGVWHFELYFQTQEENIFCNWCTSSYLCCVTKKPNLLFLEIVFLGCGMWLGKALPKCLFNTWSADGGNLQELLRFFPFLLLTIDWSVINWIRFFCEKQLVSNKSEQILKNQDAKYSANHIVTYHIEANTTALLISILAQNSLHILLRFWIRRHLKGPLI